MWPFSSFLISAIIGALAIGLSMLADRYGAIPWVRRTSIGVVGLVAVLVLVPVIWGCILGVYLLADPITPPPRQPELVQREVSPDHAYVISVYYDDPGAMASSSYEVTSRHRNGPERFAALLTDDDITFSSDSSLTVDWRGPDTVLVGGEEIKLKP